MGFDVWFGCWFGFICAPFGVVFAYFGVVIDCFRVSLWFGLDLVFLGGVRCCCDCTGGIL